MKTIGILSDTHGCWDDRFEKYFAECDEIWHAGDIGSSDVVERLERLAPVRAVAGNIDGSDLRRRYGTFQEWETEGVKVMMTHIGGYPGKYAPGIRFKLEMKRPNIFVDGHSHILKVMYDRQLHLLHINPGAAGVYGWQTVRTLIRLKLDAGAIKDLEVIELGKPTAKSTEGSDLEMVNGQACIMLAFLGVSRNL